MFSSSIKPANSAGPSCPCSISPRTTPGRCRVVLLADGPFRERLNAAGVETHVIPLSDRVSGVGTQRRSLLRGLTSRSRHVQRGPESSPASPANPTWSTPTPKRPGYSEPSPLRLARRPVVWHLRDILTAEHFSRVNRRIAILLANRLGPVGHRQLPRHRPGVRRRRWPRPHPSGLQRHRRRTIQT